MNVETLSDLKRNRDTEERSQELYSVEQQETSDRIDMYDDAIYYLEEITSNLSEVHSTLEALNQHKEAKRCKEFKSTIQKLVEDLLVDKKELENELPGIL